MFKHPVIHHIENKRRERVFVFQKYSGDFQIHGELGKDHLTHLNEKYCKLLSEIRPIAVSLVDAFDNHDLSLASTLGSYDGQVYQR